MGDSKELEVNFIEGEFQRITLGKDDVVIISCPDTLSRNVMEEISIQAKRIFPEHKVVILEAGIKMGVIGNEEIAKSNL